MPGATTKYAVPYPSPGDAISDGDDRIKALAERVDLLLGEQGSQAVTVVTGGTAVDVVVAYARTYAPLVPVVMVTPLSSTTPGVLSWNVLTSSSTGFTLRVNRSSPGTATMAWSARP